MRTLYDVLGIAATASNADIKAAYRRLAMLWHPDRNRENVAEAVTKFQELNSAYAVLSDDQRRAQYDESIQGAAQTGDSTQTAWDDMLTFAATLANAGHNRDVIVGALLAHGCPADIAQTVADASVHAAQPPVETSQAPHSDVAAQKGQRGSRRFFAVALGCLVVFAIGHVAVSSHNKSPSNTGISPAISASSLASALGSSVAVAQGASVTLSATPAPVGPIRSQLPDYDDATKSGTLQFVSFPAAQMFNTYRTFAGTKFDVHVLGRQVLVKKPRTWIYFFAATPQSWTQPGCVDCKPVIAGMVVRETPKVAPGYDVVLPITPIAVAGEKGTYDIAHRAPRINTIGKGVKGLVLTDVQRQQSGDVIVTDIYAAIIPDDAASIAALRPQGFPLLGTLPRHIDGSQEESCRAYAAMHPNSGSCFELTTDVDFVDVGTEGLYPAKVRAYGTQPASAVGSTPTTFDDTYMYIASTDGKFAKVGLVPKPVVVPGQLAPTVVPQDTVVPLAGGGTFAAAPSANQ
jgi:hypothetical protein